MNTGQIIKLIIKLLLETKIIYYIKFSLAVTTFQLVIDVGTWIS